jgi:6-phosphogluconate dehydrogenase
VKIGLIRLGNMNMNVVRRLEQLTGYVQDSGEGRWMIADAIEKDVPVPALATTLFTSFRSRQSESFVEKMLVALRNAFGGHAVRR